MGLSAPRADSLEIIALQPVRKFIGINPTRLIDPWSGALDIIDLNTFKKDINPMGISAPVLTLL